jgi:hypothetical protein
MRNSYRINGGSVRDYVPIGVDGRPVWKNAEAFLRSITVSSPLGAEAAKHLAEPEFSDGGEHVDWFVGFPPRSSSGYEVVRWDAASPEERRAAWEELERFGRNLEVYGRDLEKKALSANDELFAHYLTGTSGYEKLPAVHFPSSDCVFIVDGIPVVTFWGFLRPGQTLGGSPFQALAPSQAANPFGGTGAAAGAAAAPAAAAAAAPWWKRHLLCLILLPLLLLLLPLLLYLLWWWFFARGAGLPAFGAVPDLAHGSLDPVKVEQPLVPTDDDDEVVPVVRDRDGVVVDGDGVRVPAGDAVVPGEAEDEAVVPGEAEDEAVVPDGDAAVPEAPASQDAADDAAKDGADAADKSADDAAKDAQDKNALDKDAQDKDAQDKQDGNSAKDDGKTASATPPELKNTDSNGNLVLDPKALAKGSLRGLDGTWNTSSGLFDTKTGKPVSIKYNFDNGKGTAQVTKSDGTKCSVGTSGSVSGGALTISGGMAPCADGTKISLPKVRCTPGRNGKADCSGIYQQKKDNIKMELYK